MKKSLKNLLNQLDLIENKAVFFRDEEDGKGFDGFSTDLNKKLELIKPDAYYVFNKQPFILFFDLTSTVDAERENEIHKQVWSFDNSPIVFVIKDSEVKVYNALSYSKKEKSLDEIKLSQDEIEDKFSFWNLQSGTTWKWLQEDYYENNKKKNFRKRVNEKLFQNIKDVRQTLVDKSKDASLTDNEANTLILRLIFVRYLIDREIKIDTEFISGSTTQERRISLSSLIKNPERLNQLFIKLNANFNGALFKEIDIKISNEQSAFLANVFKGEIEEQGSLFDGFYFEIFDFSIIPVEVISGIYESLIDPESAKLDSAVYTPSFLVDYILNDTVDKYLEEKNISECKIFEVAVGSGIFLVQSLRKMIEKEIELNGNSNKKLFSERIREIAKNNLFGIDINKEALKVACFSIYIALLDYQDPKDINIYKFPDLIDENLFEANFFNVNHVFNEIIKSKKTQFILGNPPWKSKKADNFHTTWLKENNKTVGNFEIAQSFLLRSKDFMQPYAKTALIVTSTMFYNVSKTTRAFKNEFLTTFCIDKFFDLSAVKQSLFEQQESPTSIVFYHLSNNNDYETNVVKHHSLKVNSFLKNFKMLVIEKFDQKEILQRHFIENDWMFKVALYGNTLDFAFLSRLFKNNFNISDLIEKENLHKGAGIERGKDSKPFKQLIGLPVIENKLIKEFYTFVDKTNLLKENDVYLSRGRKREIFIGSKILLKEQSKDWNQPIISYSDDDCVFRKGTFSISSVNQDKIKSLYGYLISDFYLYYLFCITGAWGVGTRPAIRFDEEYLSFPIIDTDESLNSEIVRLVNNLIKPFKEYYDESIRSESLPIDYKILNKINEIVNNLYSIKGYEKDLINYVLYVSRYQFQESKQQKFLRKVDGDKDFLEKYAEVYIQEFEKIYDDEFIQIEVYPLNHFIAMNFVFSDKKPKNKIEFPKDKNDEKEVLQSLANNLSISQITDAKNSEHNLFIQKDIKGFEKNSFYIIKPNEFKCWHRAMAWYDVAEFREAIQKAEYENINANLDDF